MFTCRWRADFCPIFFIGACFASDDLTAERRALVFESVQRGKLHHPARHYCKLYRSRVLYFMLYRSRILICGALVAARGT